MSTIATLLVRLGVDADDVAKGMSKGQNLVEQHGESMTRAAAAIGLAAGAALTAGLIGAMDAESATDKLAAQIGPGSQAAADLGKVAGSLYSKGFGDSMSEVSDALKGVWQNGLIDEDASTADIEAVAAKAMNVAGLMEADYSEVTRSIGQMIKTGMVKDATEGFDLLTRGTQQGLNKSEDLLDTFNEYGTQFRKLGLDGPAAMGLISQAIKNGARDSDVAADALKEFSIRAVDGSKTSAEGFKALGLNAAAMTAQIAQGGPAAAAGLNTVLDKLRAIKDPVEQNAAAVALFGTQAEDLGAALFSMDPTTAVAGLGEVAGAADKAGSAMSDNAAHKVEIFKRAVLGTATEVAGQVIPTLMKIGSWAQNNSGLVMGFAVVLGVFAAAVGAVKVGIAAYNGAMMIWRVATLAATAAQWAWNIAMAANPLGLIILAIIAVVAAVVLLWQHCEGFRNVVTSVFGAVWDVIKAVWNWIKGNWPMLLAILTGPIGLAVLAIVRNWDSIKAGASAVKDWIVNAFNSVVGFLGSLPSRIASIASGMWNGITNGFRSMINTIIGGWNRLSFTMPSVNLGPLGSFGGFTIGVPKLPFLAKGGTVRGSGLAMVGEAGPEVLNLPRGAQVTPLDRAGGASREYHITVNVPLGASAESVGGEIVAAISSWEGINGSTWRR